MKIAMLSPIAWRTPPRHYGPWETVVSLLTEGLVARGLDVTLFATGDSLTSGRLKSVCPRGYEEGREILPKVWECLHISEVFEQGDRFDIIHNHFDFLPLTYSAMTSTPVVTTIHGFSSPEILPVYRKYNRKTFYVSISDADRSPDLDYIATVHHGIDLKLFTFNPNGGEYLLFFGRIHPEKGTRECIEVARRTGLRLIIAGIIQDREYFETQVSPCIDNDRIRYVGSAGPKERDKLLGNAFALLHPISFDEPFGLSVVEAMACGTPVIAFPRGSMPEIVVHGETGFLAADLDEMVRLVERVGDLDRKKCRKRVEDRFCVTRMVKDYIKVYKKILGVSAGHRIRPWGRLETVCEKKGHNIKRLTISPGRCIDLCREPDISGYLLLTGGNAIAKGEGKKEKLEPGCSINLLEGGWHTIKNPGKTEAVFLDVVDQPGKTNHNIKVNVSGG